MVLPHIQYVTTEIRVPCGMVKDWFPSDVKPQSSKPPYVLDVITPGGKSVIDDMYQEPFYGPGQELTYTSKRVFFFQGKGFNKTILVLCDVYILVLLLDNFSIIYFSLCQSEKIMNSEEADLIISCRIV